MTIADAEAAAARALPCYSPGYFNDGDCGKCPRCASRPVVASAILAAWKRGAEEMRERAANEAEQWEYLGHKIARAIAALKVTE